MDDDKINLEETLKARLRELPKVVQDAIVSSDVEKRLRTLSETHKLHLDQWQALENQVMLALLGFLPVEELEEHIGNEVGVSKETAATLAADISKIVFEPIRQELERELEYPAAKNETLSDIESARMQILADKSAMNSSTLPPPLQTKPATPPVPPIAQKTERGPASGAYKPGETSAARKSTIDDPYREPPA